MATIKVGSRIFAGNLGVFLGILAATSATAGEIQPELFASIANPTPSLLAQASDGDLLNQVERYNRDLVPSRATGQVSDVRELQDVSPSDWAFEALRSLVERYGCIEGYPDRTYRGNRALTRYEFAAGLNSCLNAIERLIAQSEAVAREDLATLQRLVQEFEAELAALGARIDNLEGRVAFLEDNNFSTTTKLEGQVIFAVGQIFSGEDFDDGGDADRITVFGDRVRLELFTSFTGEDELFTRLSAGNFPEFSSVTGLPQGEIGFAQPDGNSVGLEVLFYVFPLTASTQIYVAAAGGASDDFTPTLNFLDGDGAEGAISAFGTRNPIYFQQEDAGLAIIQEIGDKVLLTAGYLANPANEPVSGSGLFNGPFTAIAQLTLTPVDPFSIGFTYVHSYRQTDTGTGTRLANLAFFAEDELEIEDLPTASDSYGVQFTWRIGERFVLGGWGAYSFVRTLESFDGLLNRGSQEIVNWAVTLGFPDLGKEGSVGGIIVGSEPFVVDSNLNIPGQENEDEDFSLHVEAFYEYQISDNIAITPGVIWITSPNGNSGNEDQVIGAVRTTFSF
ncbi:MAG: iron uptake porin [Chloroflexaceae bacterium]|nr:iron uptake porin [Chloroflexaceae bacterium]